MDSRWYFFSWMVSYMYVGSTPHPVKQSGHSLGWSMQRIPEPNKGQGVWLTWTSLVNFFWFWSIHLATLGFWSKKKRRVFLKWFGAGASKKEDTTPSTKDGFRITTSVETSSTLPGFQWRGWCIGKVVLWVILFVEKCSFRFLARLRLALFSWFLWV